MLPFCRRLSIWVCKELVFFIEKLFSKGKIFSIGVNNIKQTITVTKEELIDLKIWRYLEEDN